MAYLTAPEKGLKLRFDHIMKNRWNVGRHSCNVFSAKTEGEVTQVILVNSCRKFHVETILSGWPEDVQQNSSITAIISMSPGLEPERHPALPLFRLVDAATEEEVVGYMEDVSALLKCAPREMATPLLTAVVFAGKEYTLTPLIKVGK